jgi:cell division protein FtsW
MYRFNLEKTGVHADHILIVSIFLLIGLGLVTLYSSSYIYAERFFGSSLYFISRQLIFLAIGLVLFLVVSRLDLDWIRKWSLPVVGILGSLFLCVLPFTELGVTRNGASRWFRIGSETFQPSELVKLVLPLYLAHIFDKKQEQLNSLVQGIIPPFVISLLFVIIISMQSNFSTAGFITLNAMLIFYVAGVKARYFLTGMFMCMPFGLLLILTKEYRLRRILSYLNPAMDPHGAGYQVRASIMTIESGGFWGKGIGHGIGKLASVPEVQSDFIFSSYAEEAGFVGVLIFIVLFGLFVVRGYMAAMRAPDTYRRLLAFGLVTMIMFQMLLNIAVVSGSIPATGIPLPFFSAGGSSLIMTLIAVGMVVNISRSGEESEFFDSTQSRTSRNTQNQWGTGRRYAYAQDAEVHHV